MALLRPLFPFLLRATWRELKAGDASSLTSAVALVLIWIGPMRHAIGAAPAARNAMRDGHGQPTEMLLLSATLGWFLIAWLVFATARHIPGMSMLGLRRQPIPETTLFGFAAASSALQPACVFLALVCGLAATPLFVAPAPGWGVVAATAWIVASALVAWALRLLFEAFAVSKRGRKFRTAAWLALALGLTMPFWLGGRIQRPDSGGYAFVSGTRNWLLLDGTHQKGLLVAWRGHTPGAWAAHAARGDSPASQVAKLALLAVAALGVAWWSFRVTTRAGPNLPRTGRHRRAIGRVPGLSVALGVATAKELRVLGRASEIWVGFGMAVLFTALLCVVAEVSPPFVAAGLGILLLQDASFAFNAFGFDGVGVDRYRLLPLSSLQVVVSKNLALGLWTGLQVLPVVVASVWRLGLGMGLALGLGAANLFLASVAWGNLVSLRFPSRASRATGSVDPGSGVFGTLLAFAAAVVLAVTAAACHEKGIAALVLGQAAWLVLGIATYAVTLRMAAVEFETHADRMRSRLA